MCRALPALLLAVLPAAAADPLAKFAAAPSPRDRAHWAFQPLRPVAVPGVKNAGWLRNPIDAFVLARLEKRGWSPSPPAPRAAFLRRLSLDLVGLPPTVAEQDDFRRDR